MTSTETIPTAAAPTGKRKGKGRKFAVLGGFVATFLIGIAIGSAGGRVGDRRRAYSPQLQRSPLARLHPHQVTVAAPAADAPAPVTVTETVTAAPAGRCTRIQISPCSGQRTNRPTQEREVPARIADRVRNLAVRRVQDHRHRQRPAGHGVLGGHRPEQRHRRKR